MYSASGIPGGMSMVKLEPDQWLRSQQSSKHSGFNSYIDKIYVRAFIQRRLDISDCIMAVALVGCVQSFLLPGHANVLSVSRQ